MFLSTICVSNLEMGHWVDPKHPGARVLKGAGVLGDRTRVERFESEECSNVSSSLIVYQCTLSW